MKVFISYSSRDGVAVRSLANDLEQARQQVWLDHDLGGGEAWWAEILAQIRGCDVLVFALSDNSLRSKPCRAELDYAQALGAPILPVQIGHVSTYRTDLIFTRQLVDYRDSTRNSGIALITALHERAAGRPPLPDPPPEPPPIPFEYLLRLGEAIRGSAQLSPPAQASILFELRAALEDEEDPTVASDVRELLGALRARRDVTYQIAREIDEIFSDGPEPATKRQYDDGLPAAFRSDAEASGEKVPPPDAPVEDKRPTALPMELPDQPDTGRSTIPRGEAEPAAIARTSMTTTNANTALRKVANSVAAPTFVLICGVALIVGGIVKGSQIIAPYDDPRECSGGKLYSPDIAFGGTCPAYHGASQACWWMIGLGVVAVIGAALLLRRWLRVRHR
jgi:hypothetical protein